MTLVHYVAVLEKEPDSDFGIYFPDLPGCVTAGDDEDEALRNAEEVLQFHIDGLIELDLPVPPSSAVREHPLGRYPNALCIAMIRARLPGRVRRINLTVDKHLLADIDAAAAARGDSRSGFVAEAARRLMREGGPSRSVANPSGTDPAGFRRHPRHAIDGQFARPGAKAASAKTAPAKPGAKGTSTKPGAKR